MAMQLPTSVDVRAFLRRVLRPRSRLGKTTLWFGYLAIALEILNAIIRPAPGGILSGWATFISFLFVLFALLMGLRWVRRKLLWRLRNRLIVTYVFIGVIPLILLVAMALVAAYLFAGQFATYAAMSDLQSELEHMEATNRSLATQFRNLARDGKLNQQLAGEIASASDENFRHRSVSIWEGGKGFVLADSAQATMAPIKASPSLAGDFAGFVLEDNRLHLRVVRRVDEGQHHLTVISDLPITAELLRHATSELGAITLFPPDKDRTTMTTKAGGPNPMSITISNNALSGAKRLQAGSVPPPSNSLDVQFPFATRLGVTDWESGKSYNGLLVVDTRPSRIYATLFSTLGENAGIFRDLLIVHRGGLRRHRADRAVYRRAPDAQHDKVGGRTLHRDRARQSRRTSASHSAPDQRSDGGAGAVVQLHDAVAGQPDCGAEGKAADGGRAGDCARSAGAALPGRLERPAWGWRCMASAGRRAR